MSDRIKTLLSAAAGPKGQGDEHWHEDGVDRLYFADPRDINVAGQVDVARPTERKRETEYVRLEAWVRPEVASEIIALITGESASLEKRLRFAIRSEIRESLAGAPKVEEVVPEPTIEVKALPPSPTLTASQIAAADAVRKAELDKLCKEQAEDDSIDDVEVPSGDMDDFAAPEQEVAS